MRVVGLTGSIGMGKSTAAAAFRRNGVPVHDADAAVHRLYSGPAVAAIEAAFPGTTAGGEVVRSRLAEKVVADPAALARLEAIVHPLVRRSETVFLTRCRGEGRRLAAIEVPLLFETGGIERVDVVVVVSATAAIQRERVLARPGMTEAKLDALLARQVPDDEKRRRAHFVIDSSRDIPFGARQVEAILTALA
jgi:dephospho-CoA kinase